MDHSRSTEPIHLRRPNTFTALGASARKTHDTYFRPEGKVIWHDLTIFEPRRRRAQVRDGQMVQSGEGILDTSSAAGELVFHVFGAIAHFERRLISERTRTGLAEARRQGRKPARPPLHPETVAAAGKLIDAGMSPTQAAKQLGIGRATAYRIARDMRNAE